MAAPPAPGRSWPARLGLVLGGVAVALVLLEVAVRVLDVGPSRHEVSTDLFRLSEDPLLRYELRPDVRKGPVRTNSHGMRDDPVEAGGQRRRIALIGDSIAFGYGADQEQTAQAWMERILDDYLVGEDPPVDVLGLGVTGYNVLQAVRMLELRAETFDFDAAVLFYCMNDAQDYSFELEQLRARLTRAERDFLGLASGEGRQLLDRSRLVSLVRLALASRGEEGRRRGRVRPEPDWASLQRPRWADYFIDIHREGPGWERVREAMGRLARLQNERDLPVLVVLFPIFQDLDRHPLAPLHRRVAALAAEEGLRWLDLTGLFRHLDARKRGLGVFDELHPDGMGYALSSLAVLQVLLGEGILALESHDIGPVTRAPAPLGEWATLVREMMSGAASGPRER